MRHKIIEEVATWLSQIVTMKVSHISIVLGVHVFQLQAAAVVTLAVDAVVPLSPVAFQLQAAVAIVAVTVDAMVRSSSVYSARLSCIPVILVA